MKKAARITGIVLGAIVALLVLLMLGVQIFLGSGKARQIVDKVAAESIDGSLSYSRLRFSAFRRFPNLSLTLDSVSLTYPHDRYARYDGAGMRNALLAAGRGEEADTLAAFDRFSVAVNPWRLLGRQIRLTDATLSGMRAFAHAYPDSAANWQIFKPSDKEKDTTEKALSLPPMSIGPIRITDRPTVVYTSQADSLFALLDMKEMSVRGHVRLPSEKKDLEVKNARFAIDSMLLRARMALDTVAVDLDHLHIRTPKANTANLDAALEAMMVSGRFGILHVPVSLSALASYEKTEESTDIELSRLNLDAAGIPLNASGLYRMMGERDYVKADAGIDDCDLGRVLEDFVWKVVPSTRDISTGAHLNFTATADGYLSETEFPQVNASLNIPGSSVRYKPMDLTARVELAVRGEMNPQKIVSAAVEKLSASTDGAVVSLSGSGRDLLGSDPSVTAHLLGNADLDILGRRFLSDSMKVSGPLDLVLDADTRLSELRDFHFRRGRISGRISSPGLALDMPYDTLGAGLDGTLVTIASHENGIRANVGMDSVTFFKGASMGARIRKMDNRADISKVESNGRMVPRVSLVSDNARIFFRTGGNRIGTRDLKISASLQQRVRGGGGNARRRHFLDSLQKVYPTVPRDSLLAHDRRVNPRPLPSYLTDKDFAKKDIRVDLGEDVAEFLRQWAPSAGITASGGFYASPRLPLRNRIKALDIQYNDDALDLNALQVTSGTSDVALTGKVTGIRRTLLGRGHLYGDLALESDRLNLNEFLTALEVGKDNDYEALSEEDESFVTDTLAGAEHHRDSTMTVFVIPANLDATLAVHARNVNYSDVEVSPLDARFKVARRCLQLTDTRLTTNMGDIALDAFYATRSKDDIQIGADLQLIDMSAESIIHMLPSVDDMMPALKSFKGNMGCRVSVTGQLDTMMNVIIPTVDGLVRITGRNLKVTDAGKLRTVTSLLFFKDKNIGDIEDLDVDAVIENSMVEIYPFTIGVDRYRIALMGVQGMDKSMRYNASIIRAPLLPIRFGVNIFGTLDDFRFSIGRSKYRNGEVPVFTQELDDIQYNIGDAIRNVYERGVENAVEATMQSYENLRKRKKELGYDNSLPKDFLSNLEYQQLEAEVFEHDMEGYNAEVDAEVDAALEAAMAETALVPADTKRRR